MQKRRNSIADALELRLFCIKPSTLASYGLVQHIYGLAQDCGNSSALAMELPQSCAMPSLITLAKSYALSQDIWNNTH